ncbi:adenosylcobinamide-GDP ribazoletransferase [Cohnella nanjingensis]|uniref:Adenosylcobinamide-GDP ribazoletransferase n=1 Tax=Cohnella nanjingensis TaxID=1387779 RepID=A0A7X0RXF5_9BACL|nr:adenosylcobinamide-GDP ribazoletransferase [Cohnella nanjingensis]MBB6675350.1 adenosylcobinamide-GDP ribazoletransferase [Cohnella nanjingensis]
MGGWIDSLVAALQFLTRLPVPSAAGGASERAFRRSVVLFPAAGLAIGLLTAAFGALLRWGLPSWPAAVLLTAVWIGLSGALHLDGLMDTADGLLSHRSRERMLEIMKDSRVGAMGVMAGSLSVLMRAALLASLLQDGRTAWALCALALIPVWSRAFLPAAITGWPYARAEGSGLGGLFRGVGARHAVAAFAVATALSAAVLAALVLLAKDSAGLPLGWAQAAIAWSIAAAFTYVAGSLTASAIARKLGGLTGDVYGAINELLELGLLLIMVAVLYHF